MSARSRSPFLQVSKKFSIFDFVSCILGIYTYQVNTFMLEKNPEVDSRDERKVYLLPFKYIRKAVTSY